MRPAGFRPSVGGLEFATTWPLVRTKPPACHGQLVKFLRSVTQLERRRSVRRPRRPAKRADHDRYRNIALPPFTEHRVSAIAAPPCPRPSGDGRFRLLPWIPGQIPSMTTSIPHLASAGPQNDRDRLPGLRRVRQAGGPRYSFEQQLGDLEAVVEALAMTRSSRSP